MEKNKKEKVIKEFQQIINSNSLENDSDTPDFILAECLVECLETFSNTTKKREKWYGRIEELNNENE